MLIIIAKIKFYKLYIISKYSKYINHFYYVNFNLFLFISLGLYSLQLFYLPIQLNFNLTTIGLYNCIKKILIVLTFAFIFTQSLPCLTLLD